MGFVELAVIGAVGLLGPLLALPRAWHLPVVLGELLGGIVLGPTGFGYLDAREPTLNFLADMGFALVMFVAGTHVPVRDPRLRDALGRGLVRAILVGVAAVAAGLALDRVFDIPHWSLYAVLMASSSAALVLPVIDELHLSGPRIIELLPQVAVADAVCIVALPLAIEPDRAGHAALGALAVIGAAAVVFAVLWWLEREGVRKRVHDVSEERLFATELRVQLVILSAMAALAVATGISIMLAGFAFGIAVNAVGEPRRLAKQLFALTEGVFSPLFFVWLGASLQLRSFADHPEMLGLGVLLGAGAIVTHLVPKLLGQPAPLGLMAAAQLGVPSAAVTVGTEQGLLRPGEGSALMLGALVTVGVAVLGGAWSAREERAGRLTGRLEGPTSAA
ncbi:cation:proton antiporter [Nocardioides sp. Kera G14]|uniref:cation:proton antiporter n=1 Tax=Nocardioides sp. Kera G14 TaxID=2884264 RepID=UPI001D11C677|nr:cation:proton antiporter [Nocardioides sp. Kera G14]UDY23718.1 cation:proton antiporter [Nocardioides sp. Kera G14]